MAWVRANFPTWFQNLVISRKQYFQEIVIKCSVWTAEQALVLRQCLHLQYSEIFHLFVSISDEDFSWSVPRLLINSFRDSLFCLTLSCVTSSFSGRRSPKYSFLPICSARHTTKTPQSEPIEIKRIYIRY